MNEALRALQDAVQHALGRRHFPQHVHVDAAFAVGALVGDARLVNAAGYRIGDELLVPLEPRSTVIDLRDRLPGFGVAVGVNPRKRSDASGCGPRAGAFAVGHRYAFAALYERQHLASRNHQRIERLHPRRPRRAFDWSQPARAAATA